MVLLRFPSFHPRFISVIFWLPYLNFFLCFHLLFLAKILLLLLYLLLLFLFFSENHSFAVARCSFITLLSYTVLKTFFAPILSNMYTFHFLHFVFFLFVISSSLLYIYLPHSRLIPFSFVFWFIRNIIFIRLQQPAFSLYCIVFFCFLQFLFKVHFLLLLNLLICFFFFSFFLFTFFSWLFLLLLYIDPC